MRRGAEFSDPPVQLVERLVVALCSSWQAGWTNVGLGKEGAQKVGSYWVPIYLDRMATNASPGNLGGAEGKEEATRYLR